MVFFEQPDRAPTYHATYARTTDYKDGTCAHCGKPASVVTTSQVIYKVQVMVDNPEGYYGRETAKSKGIKEDIIYRVWLRATNAGRDLEGEWGTTNLEDALDLAFKLRTEFKVNETSFVIGTGRDSVWTSSKPEMKKTMTEFASHIRAIKAAKAEASRS